MIRFGLVIIAIAFILAICEFKSAQSHNVQSEFGFVNLKTQKSKTRRGLTYNMKLPFTLSKTAEDDVSYPSQQLNKHPVCVCAYCSLLSESKQCATATTATPVSPPTPPTPSPVVKSGSIPPLQVNGIFPSLTVTASSGPQRTECGIGALMPWADKLYMVSYLSVHEGGSGTGLFAIDENFTITRIDSHNSSYANRIIHKETNQIVIGPWVIDAKGNHRVFKDLLTVRIGGTAEHLTNPQSMVYMLGMDGPLWECNVTSLECFQLFDLVKTLNIPASQQADFKAAHTMNGRLVVASNTFDEADFTGQQHGGRLAEWQGPGHDWTIISTSAFVEVTGRRNFGQVIYALGWDYRSVILEVYNVESTANNKWETFRLPKASHAFDHLWQTEWPRIREVETERYLMDMHGMFYELSPLGWSDSTWGVRPISQHLRVIPDFASYRGLLVLGGNQVSSINDNNVITGQSQSGLWFGKTDDLWSFGKPQGWGAVWRQDYPADGLLSDPYLMTGFDKKVLHIILHNAKDVDTGVVVNIMIDVTGAAGHLPQEELVKYSSYSMDVSTPYRCIIFPDGLSAHWIRLQLNYSRQNCNNCTITAYFHYT